MAGADNRDVLRTGVVAVLTLAFGAASAAPAAAQLGLPLPPLPAPPAPSGGSSPVGDVVTGVGGTVGGALEGVLGSAPGNGGGSLPAETVTDLLDQLLGGGTTGGGGGGSGGGTAGGTSGGGTTTGNGGTTSGGSGGSAGAGTTGAGAGGGTFTGDSSNSGAGAGDRTAPKLRFKILSRLGRAARTGKLRIRVTSSEPSVVAFNGLLRAGKARRAHGKAMKVSRKLFRTKASVLAFKRAGKLMVSVKLPRKARKALRRARTARVSLQSWTADAVRNQARRDVKRTLRR